jgi:hypothetical protein
VGDHVEQAHLQGAFRGELLEQRIVEFGEFVLLAGSNDELLGGKSVLDGVAGRAGLALFGARTVES